MPAQLLVAASDHRKQIKGQIIAVKDEPCHWGSAEGLPNYVIFRIVNGSRAEAERFLEIARNVFGYSITTARGVHEVTVSVDQRIVDVFGGGFTARARDYLESQWGATFLSSTTTSALFQVADTVVLTEMQDDLLDKFAGHLGPRFRFATDLVDQAIAAGGQIDLTKAQADSRIVDRLA